MRVGGRRNSRSACDGATGAHARTWRHGLPLVTHLVDELAARQALDRERHHHRDLRETEERAGASEVGGRRRGAARVRSGAMSGRARALRVSRAVGATSGAGTGVGRAPPCSLQTRVSAPTLQPPHVAPRCHGWQRHHQPRHQHRLARHMRRAAPPPARAPPPPHSTSARPRTSPAHSLTSHAFFARVFFLGILAGS